MNKFENEYIAFFNKGTKVRVTAANIDEAQELAENKVADSTDEIVVFFTNARDHLPFDYDWDEKLNCWQARLF